MSAAGAGTMLAWWSGLLLGVGGATDQFGMAAAGGMMTLMSLYYLKRFVEPGS